MAINTSRVATVVEKLKDKDDYMNWKFSMRLVLTREKLWTYATTALSADAETEGKEKDTDAWSLICLHVDKSLYPYVQNTTSANEAWIALENLFEGKTKTRWMNLWDALLDTSLSKHKNSVQDYVTSILELSNKLTSMGKPADDGLVALIMLRGLPKVCLPYRMGIEATTSDADFTTDTIKEKLLNGSLEEYLKLEGSEEDSALYARNVKNFSHQKQSGSNVSKPRPSADIKKIDKRKVKCFKCWQFGHFKSECPEKEERRMPKLL